MTKSLNTYIILLPFPNFGRLLLQASALNTALFLWFESRIGKQNLLYTSSWSSFESPGRSRSLDYLFMSY